MLRNIPGLAEIEVEMDKGSWKSLELTAPIFVKLEGENFNFTEVTLPSISLHANIYSAGRIDINLGSIQTLFDGEYAGQDFDFRVEVEISKLTLEYQRLLCFVEDEENFQYDICGSISEGMFYYENYCEFEELNIRLGNIYKDIEIKLIEE